MERRSPILIHCLPKMGDINDHCPLYFERLMNMWALLSVPSGDNPSCEKEAVCGRGSSQVKGLLEVFNNTFHPIWNKLDFLSTLQIILKSSTPSCYSLTKDWIKAFGSLEYALFSSLKPQRCNFSKNLQFNDWFLTPQGDFLLLHRFLEGKQHCLGVQGRAASH